MAQSTIWWLVAGVLVAVELLTGTFYLLMLAIGMAAAACAAHLGGNATVQILELPQFTGRFDLLERGRWIQ
jgi:membrane protein implicated in regulation of membrane protease activity